MKALKLTLRALEELHAQAISDGISPVIFGEEVPLEVLSAELEALHDYLHKPRRRLEPPRKRSPRLDDDVVRAVWARKPTARPGSTDFRVAVLKTIAETGVDDRLVRQIWRGAKYAGTVERLGCEGVSA